VVPPGFAPPAGGGAEDEPDDPHFPEKLRLPPVLHVPARALACDALDQAATARTGVALVGPKGVGKTEAVAWAAERFAAAERVRAQRDPSYQRRRVLEVSTLRATHYRETLLDLVHALVGPSHRDRVRGRVKSADELRIEAAELLLDYNVVVIRVDEGETLTEPAARALRDLMTETAARDPGRTAGAPADAGGAPAGVGLLLVGTDDLTPRLLRSDEAGQRLARLVPVAGVRAPHVAGVYRSWLPGLEPHVAIVGESEWAAYVRQLVTLGQPVAIRRLVTHVSEYVRRLARGDTRVGCRGGVYFVPDLFERTWRETAWADGTGGAA
jgi:hypothetical protein